MEVVIDDPDDFECYVNFFVAKHFAKMAGYKLVERGK